MDALPLLIVSICAIARTVRCLISRRFIWAICRNDSRNSSPVSAMCSDSHRPYCDNASAGTWEVISVQTPASWPLTIPSTLPLSVGLITLSLTSSRYALQLISLIVHGAPGHLTISYSHYLPLRIHAFYSVFFMILSMIHTEMKARQAVTQARTFFFLSLESASHIKHASFPETEFSFNLANAFFIS